MKVHYLSCAETAKLIRAALKKSFPTVKFSVRSSVYSGGASIDVSWVDGPTSGLVDGVAKSFAGGRFDGMIDMKIHVQHWLMPDGTITIASNPGTVGSAGSIPAEREWMPDVNAKLVSFGTDFVFTNRKLSEKFVRQAVSRLARQGLAEFADVAVKVAYDGSAYIDGNRMCEARGIPMDQVFYRETARLMIA